MLDADLSNVLERSDRFLAWAVALASVPRHELDERTKAICLLRLSTSATSAPTCVSGNHGAHAELTPFLEHHQLASAAETGRSPSQAVFRDRRNHRFVSGNRTHLLRDAHEGSGRLALANCSRNRTSTSRRRAPSRRWSGPCSRRRGRSAATGRFRSDAANFNSGRSVCEPNGRGRRGS